MREQKVNRGQMDACDPFRTFHRAFRISSYHLVVTIIFAVILSCSADNLQAPKFTIQPSSTSGIVQYGHSKILQCKALGYPQPLYRWTKDGVPQGPFSPEPYHKIFNTKFEDVGSYQCIAKNDVGAIISHKIDINVAFMGVFKDNKERDLVVESGDAAVIDLPPIESHPPPYVIWQSNDNSTLYDTKYAVSADRQFIILSVDESDQKAYRARATNPQMGKDENSAYVNLLVRGDSNREVGPQIIIAPKDGSVNKGDQIDLQCIANARPLHELETLWFKDGIAINNAGISYSIDPWNRTLTLNQANLTYNGQYTCSVRMRSGGYPSINASANVDVLESPSFSKTLRPDLLGEIGGKVVIPCDALGVPQPNITWYRNAVEINPKTEKRYIIEEDGSLVIQTLQMDDVGMFQCFAANKAGEDSISVWLKVKTSAPVMQTPPQDLTVLDGEDVTLNCRAVGSPVPNVTWVFLDGEALEDSRRSQIMTTGDLLIVRVRKSDSGRYTCTRANEAGQVSGTAHLNVRVRTQIIQPPENATSLLGLAATFQCHVTGDPSVPYQLTWYHDGDVIGSIGTPNGGTTAASQRVTVGQNGMLRIEAVRPSDVGTYTCELVSPGGNETRSAKLSVIELPYAPTNVHAERIDQSHRSINVSWTPGFDGNSPIRQFIVQKREVSDLEPGLPSTEAIPASLNTWVTEISNVSASRRWVLLENLKAAAAYEFRVSAENTVGEGSWSDPSNKIVLPQEAPSGPPLGLVGSARSTSEIIIQWQPPLEEHRNGQILGYVIRYRLSRYKIDWTYWNITNEAQRNYLIQDLITWRDYVFEIAAFNNKGVGVYSEGVTIKTKEGVPGAAPTQVRVKSLNSTAVEVWWRPPDPQMIYGINQGYKLQAWKGDPNTEESAARVETVPPSLFDPLAEQKAVIGSLEKFTMYNITVLCYTNPGDGRRSTPVVVRTDEDVPDEVASIQFHEVSDRAVTVRWTPPKQANGVLTGYQLTYMVTDRPDTLRTENLTADTLSLKVEHLQATTEYRFELRAATQVGFGVPRVATIQSGIEPVLPKPPTKLAVTNIEAFSVVLQFTPGFDGNSSITAWTVEAQTARNTTWFKVDEKNAPKATTLNVTGLTPFTLYKLRIISNNVVGASEPSGPTKEFQTIQAPPAHPPHNVTVRAMSATELRVRWIPLQQIEWFGNPRGYNITYYELDAGGVPTGVSKSVTIDDHTANSHILDKLEEWALYQIEMKAFNDVGSSSASPPAIERTRESVPSFGPMNVEANATSSTTVVVRWGEVPHEHCNGQIEGYKVAYYGTPSTMAVGVVGVGGTGSSVQYKVIASNSTFTTTLTELRKYVQYNVQVLAFTRLGDGELSTPPVRVRTFEDTPGAPSNVSFPDVSQTTARIIWDVPDEHNGEILAYRVTYRLNDSTGEGNATMQHEFPPSWRTFRATNLLPERYYLFTVTAQTRLGWGKTASALVLSTNNREPPQPPSVPQVSRSQIQSAQITFSWTPGRDGYAPLRYYTVQFAEGNGPWQTIPERVDPQINSYTAANLKPYTAYRFRIQSTNDIGPSGWSAESAEVRTLSAAPSKGVTGVHVVPITTTSVRVHWEPLAESDWSGDSLTGGYRIVYQPESEYPKPLQAMPKLDVMGTKSNNAVLEGLTRDRNHEVVVLAFNSQGAGPPSPPVTVYVGEAVPTGEPRSVEAEPLSPTEVRLKWTPPVQSQQNGDLLGYKIFYVATETPQPLEDGVTLEEELEVVPATSTSHSLVFLDKYTQYQVAILAFNPAGDGPRSQPVTVRTLQGLPGPPANLYFTDITMSSLNVSWDPPKKRNGELMGYIVTYETAEQNEGFSNQVKRKVSGTSLLVQNLEEKVTYLFTVRAQTIDYGPSVSSNVTTGPQEGSPTPPRELALSSTVSTVELHWMNGASGKGPILGYYIQSKRRVHEDWQIRKFVSCEWFSFDGAPEWNKPRVALHLFEKPYWLMGWRFDGLSNQWDTLQMFGVSLDTRWQTVVRTSNGPLTDYSVSFQNLQPSTHYNFRVIAFNKYGVSDPVVANDAVLTPSKLYLEYGYLQHKPFYRQTWFMVALASSSIIIIIMIIAILCVKSKSYKYKQKAQKALEESMAMDMDDRHELAHELYRARHAGPSMGTCSVSTLGRRNTLGRKATSIHPGPPPPMMGKSPPRPSPASVAYHSDEESLKGYDENPDDSSVTEKPSEISSTDSQGSESEPESERSDPHSFVNHYANVNDSLRQSWKRQKPVRNYSSYTDSEPEGAGVMSLNGGQIIMNNMARSRAPLPGFSSFV